RGAARLPGERRQRGPVAREHAPPRAEDPLGLPLALRPAVILQGLEGPLETLQGRRGARVEALPHQDALPLRRGLPRELRREAGLAHAALALEQQERAALRPHALELAPEAREQGVAPHEGGAVEVGAGAGRPL